MKLVPRKLMKELVFYLNAPEILCIRGPRQAGKTTLMKMLQNKLRRYSTFFVNLDLPNMRMSFEENPLDFVQRRITRKKLILFLDEVQKSKNIGENLKILFDELKDVKIIVSGSSSLEIKSKLLPFLVGRIFLFELFPFDFYESVYAKDEKLARLLLKKQESLKHYLEGKEILKPSFTNELTDMLKEYLIFGGYPRVVTSQSTKEKKKVLTSIRDLYIEKDIISFFHIEDTSKFESVIKYLAFNSANLLNLSTCASVAGVSFREAEKFLEIAKHTYIIDLLNPFHRNMSTELRKMKKVYFLDLGMRNSVINNFSEFDSRSDKGNLLETFVYRELRSNFNDWEIRYWRTTGKAEVDFVLLKEDRIVPVEVKLSGKPTRAFWSFCSEYKPDKAIIVTLDTFKLSKHKDTELLYIPAFYL